MLLRVSFNNYFCWLFLATFPDNSSNNDCYWLQSSPTLCLIPSLDKTQAKIIWWLLHTWIYRGFYQILSYTSSQLVNSNHMTHWKWSSSHLGLYFIPTGLSKMVSIHTWEPTISAPHRIFCTHAFDSVPWLWCHQCLHCWFSTSDPVNRLVKIPIVSNHGY